MLHKHICPIYGDKPSGTSRAQIESNYGPCHLKESPIYGDESAVYLQAFHAFHYLSD